ncbi:hypothetical protein SAMN05216308_104224 [Nitrosospira sp. Nsp13]|nr:hypothetical protein SAMN05216308_104224 [Nitrosospira sp. Nsp13]
MCLFLFYCKLLVSLQNFRGKFNTYEIIENGVLAFLYACKIAPKLFLAQSFKVGGGYVVL